MKNSQTPSIPTIIRSFSAPVILLATVLFAGASSAANQNTVLAELELTPENWNNPALQVQINGESQGSIPSVALGDSISVSVSNNSPSSFLLVMVDSYGDVELIKPAGNDTTKATHTFTADAPVGQYSLFAFASDATLPDLGTTPGQTVSTLGNGVDGVRNLVSSLVDFGNSNQVIQAPEYQFSIEDNMLAFKTRGLKKRIAKMQVDRQGQAPVRAVVKKTTLSKSAPAVVVETPQVQVATVEAAQVAMTESTAMAKDDTTYDSLSLDIKFQLNSKDLTQPGINALDSLGSALVSIQRGGRLPVIMLEGHTDDTGEDNYNLTLSENRANSARDYLLNRFGLPANSIRAMGFGETTPLTQNTSAAARRANRRVELKVVE